MTKRKYIIITNIMSFARLCFFVKSSVAVVLSGAQNRLISMFGSMFPLSLFWTSVAGSVSAHCGMKIRKVLVYGLGIQHKLNARLYAV
jgi:hypothetical protein